MKQIFISSVQKEFERERAAIKKMIETDPIIKPHFKAFVFEIDAPAADKSTRQVYLEELEKCDIYLVLVGDKYGYCKGDEPSPTEQEFDKAQELGLTKLIMVRGTDNSKREPKEARFLEKISDGRVRVRYQDSASGNAMNDLLDEVRNSIRDIMLDEGIIHEVPLEDQVHPEVSMDDISDERIRWFVESAVRIRNANYSLDMTKEDVLRSLHLLNHKRRMPTNAALLLFGKDPQYFFQSSQIKCACYLGLEKAKPNSDIRLLEGDLFRLADQAIAYINDHLDVGAGEHNDGAASDEVREIPNAVIAEAVNNAIAHRNYANVGSVQIEIYRDRIEIINPGRLHPSLTIQDLYRKHESYPPNSRIAHALYQVKYIEALGTGITDLLNRCKKAGLKRPLFEEVSGKFRITIWRNRHKTTQHKANAALFEQLVIAELAKRGEEGAKFADLQRLASELSRGLCQSVLRKLRKEGKIHSKGVTSSARWFVGGEETCNRLATN